MEALTSAQKAAIIISSIGTENASEVFKHFSDEEVEQITLEIARMNYYPMEVVDSVLNEFYELCLTQKVISEGGVEYARDILEKAFGPQTAQALFEKITKQFQTKAFAFVRKADYKNLLAMVQNEHPQTIALILSYARSDQASAILRFSIRRRWNTSVPSSASCRVLTSPCSMQPSSSSRSRICSRIQSLSSICSSLQPSRLSSW